MPIFELATLGSIVSAVSALNSAVSLARDTQQSAESISEMMSTLTNTESRILRYEQNKKSKRPLTSAEAMKISLAKRDAQALDRKLHDMCLSVNGGMELYRNMQQIKARAQADHTKFLKTVAKRRAARKKRIMEYITAFAAVFAMLLILVFGYVGYQYIYKPLALQKEKNRLEIAREKVRNMRKCGRPKC